MFAVAGYLTVVCDAFIYFLEGSDLGLHFLCLSQRAHDIKMMSSY